MSWNTGGGEHFIAANPASGNATFWGAKTGRYNVKDPANPNGAAKGDAVTDDTSPLQGPASALTVTFVGGDFEWTGGGIAEIGPGTYPVSGTLPWKANMAYEGAGWGSTIIDATLGAGVDCISADAGGIKRSAIRDLTIRLNTGRDAIRMDKGWQCDFERLRLLTVSATGNGITIMSSSNFGSYVNNLHRIRAQGFAAGAGIYIDGFDGTFISTGTMIYNAWCNGCQEGIHLGQYTGTMTLINCEPQSNSLNGVYIAGGLVQIIGGSIEGNTARGIDIASTAGNLTLLGPNFSGNGQNIRNNSADANMNFFGCTPKALDQITIGGVSVLSGAVTIGADILGSLGFAIRQNTGSILLDTGAGGTIGFRTNNDGGQKAILDSVGKLTKYNNRTTAGIGVPAVSGLDNRSGVTAVDGAPITLFANPVGANQVYIVSAHLDATAFTSGTATYTITWTENGVAKTLAISVTALNTPTFAGPQVIKPDASTNITGQLTGVFTATVTLAAVVEAIVQL